MRCRLLWQHYTLKDGSPVIQPLFVMNDAFMRAHMLQYGQGLTRANSLVGLTLQPCEEANFSKIAIRSVLLLSYC